jgi:MYXO-CTERM domain-containing protein
VGLSRSITVFGLFLFAACETDVAPRGTYVVVDHVERGLRTSTATPILYLNPCREGCFLEPGADDARTNRSSIVAFPAELEPFPWNDDVWARTVRCVQRLYAPFEITVTDVDPGNVIHTENIVAGHPRDIGQPGDVGGIAPLACGGLENAISFSFAAAIGEDIESLCHTIGQETAHAFGLDHELLCSDPMTYLPRCGEKAFQRIDAPCGEHEPRRCLCGEAFQNSHLTLLALLGPRRTPIRWPPEVRIGAPSEDDSVEPHFRVFVEASDDVGLERVDLFIDGEPVGSSNEAPFVFLAPADLELGPHEILARAYDVDGLEAEDRLHLTAIAGRPRPDASVIDRGFSRASDGGAIFDDPGDGGLESADLTTARDDDGCGCSTSNRSRSGVAAIVILVLAFFSLRRPRVLLLSVLALFGCDDTSLGVSSGRLVLDPPPGTVLSFAETIIGQTKPRPIVIVAKNEGTGFLTLGPPRIEGTRAITVPIWPETIAPGEKHEIFLRLEPGRVIDAEATFVMPSNDRALPEARYPVQARSRESCRLEANPEWLTFDVGQTKEARIVAASTSPCTITRLTFDERLFQLIDPPTLPVTIEPGAALELSLRHTRRTTIIGRPVRELWAFAVEGAPAIVRLEGAPPVSGCAEVYPPKIRFPLADRGTVTRARAIVANHCESVGFEVISAAASGAIAFTAPSASFPIIVPPLGEAEVFVEYRPESDRAELGTLHLRTTDSQVRAASIELEGIARLPRLVTLPEMDLGGAEIGCSARPGLVPIYNMGAGALPIASVSIEPEDGPFTIVGAYVSGVLIDASLPFSIPAYEAAHVLIELSPVRAGDVRAEIAVREIGSSEAARTAIIGRGTASGRATDRFVEPEGQDVDLLWVVDDSCSMAIPGERLVAASPALLEAMDRSLARDQMSVVRADSRWPDGGWPERCVPHPAVLTPGYPEASFALQCMLSVGARGREVASGLGAAVRFVENAIAPPSREGVINPAAGFLRKSAKLAVIVASDEEDLSTEPLPLLRDFFRALKGYDRADLVTLHAIAGGERSCRSTSPWVQAGLRYRSLALELGGTFHEICDEDYRPHLEEIARVVLSPSSRRYSLSRPADPAGLIVTVGGAQVIADALDGYTFDARTNTIELHGASVPRPGQVIEAAYGAECRPPFRDPR